MHSLRIQKLLRTILSIWTILALILGLVWIYTSTTGNFLVYEEADDRLLMASVLAGVVFSIIFGALIISGIAPSTEKVRRNRLTLFIFLPFFSTVIAGYVPLSALAYLLTLSAGEQVQVKSSISSLTVERLSRGGFEWFAEVPALHEYLGDDSSRVHISRLDFHAAKIGDRITVTLAKSHFGVAIRAYTIKK